MAASVTGPPRARTYRPRFVLVYAALALAAGGALGAAAVILSRPGPKPPPVWSTWRPKGPADLDRVRQIAKYVSSQYRTPNGAAPTQVRGGPLVMGSQPLLLATRPNAKTTSVALVPGATVEYNLCGDKTSCAVGNAPAGIAGPLTRRESFELALYTFKYVHSAKNVVVIMPPLFTNEPARLLLLKRGQVNGLLDRPLRLPGRPPKVTPRDAESIALETDPYIFHFELAQINQTPALVVNPIALSSPKAPSSSGSGSGS